MVAKSNKANGDLPTVCVIGAGSSGIAVLKKLRDRGIPADCYEKTDHVGGLWAFGEGNRKTAAYRSLHINTSRDRMAYRDFPMPRDYPDFPHHALMARYFESYVQAFGLKKAIEFGTAVEHAARRPEGGWTVKLEGGKRRDYDALIVANGHHWDPRWPDPLPKGKFNGTQMHSHDYIDDAPFAGKNVVVVGMGNSAMDIAVELSRSAARTYLSARRGAHVVPKYLFGRPLDTLGNDPRVPFRVRRRLFEIVLWLHIGRVENYGLPKPDHRLGGAHPTVSSEILSRLGHGDIVPKPPIERLKGAKVRFADGSEEAVDAIIYGTGYNVCFPFLDETLVSAPDNDLPLFRRVFRPGQPDLFFVGLIQPLGATMPIAEAQGEWLAEYLAGEYALPAPDAMAADMARERAAMQRRYVASPRHTMQIDFDDYLYDLKKERRRGRKRARARVVSQV